MLYPSILLLLLSVVKSQDYACDYGPNPYSEDGELFGGDVGADMFTRDGSEQYVVYDFAILTATAIRGEYFLPYLIANDSGTSYCHNSGFTTGSSISFECSTDGNTMYARNYGNGNCNGAASSTIWWESGYSPYFQDSGAVTTMSMCNSSSDCTNMNYTRQEVTQGTGSRYDFSCDGSTMGVSATLCVTNDCDAVACATVLAAVGAGCIQTPNATSQNLLVSCDKNKKEAYLTTYVDFVAGANPTVWNDYTVDHSCTDDGTTGFACNSYTATEDCELLFTTSDNLNIYGRYNECDENLSGDSSSLTPSIILLVIAAIFAILNH